MPLRSIEELAEAENLDGITGGQLATLRRRAVPQPGAALRDAPTLTNEPRLDVPTTVVCTGNTAERYRGPWRPDRRSAAVSPSFAT
jgi:hypothetical protein